MESFEEIEYPGTLDAQPDIDALLSRTEDGLVYNFAPGCHPLVATEKDTMQLLVKVNSMDPDRSRIVGIVRKSHRFRSMADFQPLSCPLQLIPVEKGSTLSQSAFIL